MPTSRSFLEGSLLLITDEYFVAAVGCLILKTEKVAAPAILPFIGRLLLFFRMTFLPGDSCLVPLTFFGNLNKATQELNETWVSLESLSLE